MVTQQLNSYPISPCAESTTSIPLIKFKIKKKKKKKKKNPSVLKLHFQLVDTKRKENRSGTC